MRDFGMPLANSLEHIIGVSDQRDERREAHRRGHRHAELAEQSAGVAGHERHRHEHRHQHQRGRDDGEADFLRAVDGREHRRLARFDAPHDVLEHDDGVVDHQADGQHRGQQRERVDRVVSASITMAAAMMDTGIVTAGISVARKVPRNRKMTMSTRNSVSVSAEHDVLERRGDEHAIVDVDLDA